MRILFALVFAFAFLSSDTAMELGVERARMAAFAAAVATLAALAVVRSGGLDPRGKTVPVLLSLLLAAMALRDIGHGVALADYKLVLPVLVLLVAPDVARAMGRLDPARLVALLLALYVALAAVAAVASGQGPRLRGYGDFVRWDFTGSLVTHSGLCLVFLAAAASGWREPAFLPRPLLAVLAAIAAAMVLMAATRTVIVTLVLLALLHLAGTAEKARVMRRILAGACAATAIFALYTVLVSDAFFLRLFSPRIEDFSSGRAHSQLHWLALAAEHPLGLGLGAVRELLGQGRPALDSERLLEWPHNEWVRLFVEGGIAGLAWLALLAGALLHRTLAAARSEPDPLRRALMLAILADMLAQSLLQNYLNAIYYSTAMILTLAVLIRVRPQWKPATAQRASPRAAGLTKPP